MSNINRLITEALSDKTKRKLAGTVFGSKPAKVEEL